MEKILKKLKLINFNQNHDNFIFVKETTAVFFSGNLVYKFQVENPTNETGFFEYDKGGRLGGKGWREGDASKIDLEKLLDYFKLEDGSFDTLNLPILESFDFIQMMFKNFKESFKTFLKIEANKIEIEAKLWSGGTDKIYSFEFDIENQKTFNFEFKKTFKTFLELLKVNKFNKSLFIKKSGNLNLIIAKNDNFELLTTL